VISWLKLDPASVVEGEEQLEETNRVGEVKEREVGGRKPHPPLARRGPPRLG